MILRLDCSRIEGNLPWGSLVSHKRNFLSGFSILSSFSRDGSQDVTKCRFLRQTHSPLCAAFLTSSTAASFCPPPIASSWKHCLPTTFSANSCSSLLGSEPGVIMNKMGSRQFDSFSYKFLRANGAGWTCCPPKASFTKCYIADSRRSGRKIFTAMHL